MIQFKNAPSTKLSNKPPHSSPSPNPALFCHSVDLADGRTVWFARPLPDKLSFAAYLHPEHFKIPEETGEGEEWGFKSLVEEFGAGLAHSQQLYGSGAPGFYLPQSHGLMAKAALRLGKRGATVRLELRRKSFKGQVQSAYLLRVEFNPRKLGPAGTGKLIEVLQQASAVPLDLGSLLAGATVTRLDVALDLAGLTPGELVLVVKDSPKVVTYRSSAGRLETVQLHREKKPPAALPKKRLKPLGALLLKAYDRNQQRAAAGKPPPYDGYEVTRLEVVRKRFTPALRLPDIPGLLDPFSRARVRCRDDLDPWGDLPRWRSFVSCRETMGLAAAVEATGLSASEIKPALAPLTFGGSNLIPPQMWKGWNEGLEWCGLSGLIELASSPEKVG